MGSWVTPFLAQERSKREAEPRAANGFTLIEMMVTLLIIAFVSGIVITGVQYAPTAELRRGASMLAGTIRASYDRATLTGNIHRLVLDVDNSTIRVEQTPPGLQLAPDSNALAEASKAQEEDEEADEREGPDMNPAPWLGKLDMDFSRPPRPEEEAPGFSVAQAFLGIGSLGGTSNTGSGGGSFQPTEHQLTLDQSVRLLDVWVEGMNDPVVYDAQEKDKEKKKVFLYFFPNGFTQDAVINLCLADEKEKDEGRVFAIRVHALTGGTEIFDEHQEPPS